MNTLKINTIITLENDCKMLTFNNCKVVIVKPYFINNYGMIKLLKVLSDCDYYCYDAISWANLNDLWHTFKICFADKEVASLYASGFKKHDILIAYLYRVGNLFDIAPGF